MHGFGPEPGEGILVFPGIAQRFAAEVGKKQVFGRAEPGVDLAVKLALQDRGPGPGQLVGRLLGLGEYRSPQRVTMFARCQVEIGIQAQRLVEGLAALGRA